MLTLPGDELEEVLANAFISILDLGISTVRHTPTYPHSRPSYNIIMTREHIHLIPRGKETYTLPATGDEISVNALGFAGLILAKSETELEAVKAESMGKVLESVGLAVVDTSKHCSTTEAEL